MTKDHEVKLDGLEFSVGASFETRPSTHRWKTADRRLKGGKPGKTGDENEADTLRGIPSKPSR